MELGIQMALSFQRGEQKGFEYFFNEFFDSLCHYAYRFVKDLDISKDVVERAFLIVWERRQMFSHHLVIQDYIHVTVRNECLNILKRHKYIDSKIEGLNRYEISRLSTSEADQTLIRAETKAIVNNWLKQLPTECGRIMKLMYVDGLTAREIAEHLELDISTVKNQKARGLEIIQSINKGTYKKRQEVATEICRITLPYPIELANVVFVEVPKATDKPAFIPWRRGRPKGTGEECKWHPSERNEKIYNMFMSGTSKEELQEIFELKIETIGHIIRDEHKSARIKNLFTNGKKVMDVARVVKLSVLETIKRINFLFKINLYEDYNRSCYLTYQTIVKDYPHLQEKEGVGDIGCLEDKYG